MLRRTGISTIMVVAVAFVALAAGPPQLPIQQNMSSSEIEWAPGFAYDSALLVVSGPNGFVLETEFGPQEKLAYGVSGANGSQLVDGRYTWQLTVRRALSGAEASALKAAADEALRLRAEADQLHRSSVSAPEVAGSTADTKDVEPARREQIASADVDAARAEQRVDDLMRELEKQNGRFAVIKSGGFVVEGSVVSFDRVPTGNAGDDPDLGSVTGLKLEADDSGTASASIASQPSPQASMTPGLKTYFADDVETAGGICAGCASGTNPSTGNIYGDNLYAQDAAPFVYWDDTDATSAWLAGQYTTNDFKIIDWDNGQTTVFLIEELADANNLYIDSTGNIGLRTNAPVTDLHIAEFAPEVRLDDTSTGAGFADIGYNSNIFYVEGNSSQDMLQINGDAPAASISVSAGGDVGLGKASPVAELEISRLGLTRIFMEDTGTGAADWGIWNQNPFGFLIGEGTANGIAPVYFVIRPDGDAAILEGDFGVKGDATAATLHVFESDSALHSRVMGRLEGSNFEPQFEYTNASTGKTWRLGSNPSGQFVINQTDDLGIAELLITPDGVVRVNGTQVHPDYVFDSSYELMSLPELKQFVSANGHLPGVVSAEKANGTIELTSLPLQMLEKIEELALYTIEQHEQIASQQAIIDEQRQQNEAMQAEIEALKTAVRQLGVELP